MENIESNNKEKSKNNGKALKVVTMRNNFFYIFYRHSILVFITSLLGVIIAGFFLLFYSQKPVSPQYIAVNENGTYFNLEPLSTCKSQVAVQKFVINGIKKINKFDYINYPEQINEGYYYFTSKGWNDYLQKFEEAKILTTLKNMNGISSVEILNAPEILREGLDSNNVCSWEVRVNARISFYGKNQLTYNTEYILKVERNSIIYNPEGLGISLLIIKSQKN